VLREALRKTKKVGIGQLALRGREYAVSLKACGRGMVLETLRYAEEVNKAASYFREIGDAKPDEDLMDLATTLIEKKSGKFDAGEFHDRYVDALRDLIDRKRKSKSGKTIIDDKVTPAQARGSNVVDLMAALKKSLEKPAAKSSAAVKTTPAKASADKPAARKPAAKKPAAKPAPARKRA
jgi:DNA end-binding protein Ku